MKISFFVLLVSVLAAYCVDLSMYICAPDMANCGISVSSCTLDNKTPDGGCFALDPCIGLSGATHGSFVASGGGYQLRGFSDANCNTQVGNVDDISLTNAGCTTRVPAWTCSFIIREGTPAITGNAWNGWQYTDDCSLAASKSDAPVPFGDCSLVPFCDSNSNWIKVTAKAGASDMVEINQFRSQSDCMNNMNSVPSLERVIFDLEARPQGSCTRFSCNSTSLTPFLSFNYASLGNVPSMVGQPSTGMTPSTSNTPTTSGTGNTPTTVMTPSASTSNTPTTMTTPTTTLAPTTTLSPASFSQQILPHVFVVLVLFTLLL